MPNSEHAIARIRCVMLCGRRSVGLAVRRAQKWVCCVAGLHALTSRLVRLAAASILAGGAMCIVCIRSRSLAQAWSEPVPPSAQVWDMCYPPPSLMGADVLACGAVHTALPSGIWNTRISALSINRELVLISGLVLVDQLN